VGNTRVLVDLAEEVLTVDQLEPPSKQPAKLQAQSLELLILVVTHVLDQLLLNAATALSKTLSNPVAALSSS